MRQAKKIWTVVISVLVIAVLFVGLQRLVEPKYDGTEEMPLEGNFTAEYYQETTDHDVIMVGDCEVYENIDTMYLWKNYGITSYIRGNAQQLAWQSYYMLEDTLRQENPEVVIYNVQALEHGEPQRETYNRMTLDGLKWSKTKWDAIHASMCEGENMVEYILPILRYHSRITSLSRNDLKYYWQPRKVTHNGYYMRIDVLPASESDVADPGWLLGDEEPAEEEEPEEEDLWAMMEEEEAVTEEEPDAAESGVSGGDAGDSEKEVIFGEKPMKYLDKMRKLCRENDIQLILMKAPSLSPIWYDSENKQVMDYAAKYDLPYINFYDLIEKMGIDYETDTYDGGLHLNRSGADKLSQYLGQVLRETYGVQDHREDADIAKVYEEKYQFYEDMIKAQQKELDRYGEIRSY